MKISIQQVAARLGNNGLDSIVQSRMFGSDHLIAVQFKKDNNDLELGALLLHLDLEEMTFSVGASSTASTKTFHYLASAYQRASAFLLDLGFKAK